MIEKEIHFAPIRPEDQAFLYQVYASTRQEEMALLDWNAEQKSSFLEMQFAAQHKYYTEQYTRAQFHVIYQGEEPIGRLYLDRRTDEFRIIDIALLPKFRNQGIGSALMDDILAEAQQSGLPVSIHVEHFNPALSWYKRLGFKHVSDNGVYFLMEWQPSQNE